jgi:hypothetical protein
MILAAIAALTMTAQAQNWGEVYVGNVNDADIYNGSYFDMAPTNFYVAHTGVQMLYTPDLLADMNGKQNVMIKSLDFWFNCQTFEEITRNVKIYLQEVDATEFAINQDGVKQFFTFDNPVKEMQINYDLLYYYGDDVCFNFDFEPFAFTPGKSLLVTMVFDAEDDDNCTMGSDYAPFYTSGIRGKAMTYTNNWTSFVDYANGNDFPDATAMLGCGTNVELPVTKIGYNYDAIGDPCAKPEGSFENGVDFHGVTVTLINNETAEGTELHYNITLNGVMVVEDAIYDDAFALTVDGEYYIDFWATAPGMQNSSHGGLIFTIDEETGLSELLEGKTVAGVRYFNMAGQEMQEANGMTIIVTTYTDGTTSAAKVVK